MFKKRTEKSAEKSMDTTTTASTTTTTNLKSKKFPTMFKKMMLSSKFCNFLIFKKLLTF